MEMGIEIMQQKLVRKVQTVLGLIEPEAIGITITHEHLLVDEAHLYSEPLLRTTHHGSSQSDIFRWS